MPFRSVSFSSGSSRQLTESGAWPGRSAARSERAPSVMMSSVTGPPHELGSRLGNRKKLHLIKILLQNPVCCSLNKAYIYTTYIDLYAVFGK